MAQGEILQILSRIRAETELTNVALSGGEPLLRDDLPAIAGDIDGLGLSPLVITNAVRLTPKRLKQFPSNCLFEVTLFSSKRDIHDRIAGRKVFDRVLENLVLLKKNKFSFVVACIVNSMNAVDVGETIKLAVALGAEAILFNRINISRRIFPVAGDLVPSLRALQHSLAAADELASRYGITISISVPIPACVVSPKDFPNLHFGWCPRGGETSYYTIGCSGLLRPCNHSSMILGDMKKDSFREIVTRPQAIRFWQDLPEECVDCASPHKENCRGGCPAAADECYGTRSRRDPFVDLVIKKSRGGILK